MKLTQLQYFSTVCKYNNFTKAAEELHLSQPALTVAVKELETEFEIPLLKRDKRNVSLTQEGKIFFEKAKNILEQVNSLKDEMSDLGKGNTRVKFGLPLQLGISLLPLLFIDFYDKYPQIKLDIIEGGAVELLRMVNEEKIDLTVVGQCTDDQPMLSSKLLYESEFCLCTYPEHPLSRRRSVNFEEIANEPLIMLSDKFFINKTICKKFSEICTQPNIISYTDHVETVKNIVRCGRSSAFLLKEAFTNEKDIIAIPINDLPPVTIRMFWRKECHISTACRKLMSFLQEKLIESGKLQ